MNFTIFDDVNASVEDGVLTLAGKVTMPFKKDDLARRVSRVDGVREVRNRIEVLPVSGFDNDLRYRIARAIYGNANFWNYAAMVNPSIHIVVDGGRVTLTGVVASEVERMLARALAASFNAFSVTSDLKTDQEIAATFLMHQGVSATAALRRGDPGHRHLHRRRRGVVPPVMYPPPIVVRPALPTSGLAVASMVLGIIGAAGGFMLCGIPCLVAILLGHMALAETKNEQKSGRGMAVAGLILGYIFGAPTLIFIALMAVGVVAAPFTGS